MRKWFFILLALAAGCAPNNVTVDDALETYFKAHQVQGCFALFDNGQGRFQVYNLSRYKDSAYLPASTFKIVNSLIALKTGKVFDEKAIIPWDGKIRTLPGGGDTASAWNKDLSLQEAFKVSAVPHFQELARRIGRDTMQQWLDSLAYGNRKIGPRVDSFWLDNSLKVTPDEQLGLVKKLYFGQLPFDARSQRIVKQMMLQENNSNYQLAYKTGLARRENGNLVAWVVGWIEENKHPYFFVLNAEAAGDAPLSRIRLELLRSILKHYGFFEGRK